MIMRCAFHVAPQVNTYDGYSSATRYYLVLLGDRHFVWCHVLICVGVLELVWLNLLSRSGRLCTMVGLFVTDILT